MKLNQLSPTLLLRVIRTFATENVSNPDTGSYIEDMLRQAGVETIPAKFTSEINGWHVKIETLSRAEHHVVAHYLRKLPEGLTWLEILQKLSAGDYQHTELTEIGLLMGSSGQLVDQMRADLNLATKLILESGGAL